MAKPRADMNEVELAAARERGRRRTAQRRANETPEEREARLAYNKTYRQRDDVKARDRARKRNNPISAEQAERRRASRRRYKASLSPERKALNAQAERKRRAAKLASRTPEQVAADKQRRRERRRPLTEEQRDAARARARQRYGKFRERILDALRSRTDEEREGDRQRSREWYAAHRERALAKERLRAPQKRLRRIANMTADRWKRISADRRGLAFTLTEAEFQRLYRGACAYCGASPGHSVDRVDNELGYHVGNCVSACKRCNMLRAGMRQDEFVRAAMDIARHQRRLRKAAEREQRQAAPLLRLIDGGKSEDPTG